MNKDVVYIRGTRYIKVRNLHKLEAFNNKKFQETCVDHGIDPLEFVKSMEDLFLLNDLSDSAICYKLVNARGRIERDNPRAMVRYKDGKRSYQIYFTCSELYKDKNGLPIRADSWKTLGFKTAMPSLIEATRAYYEANPLQEEVVEQDAFDFNAMQSAVKDSQEPCIEVEDSLTENATLKEFVLSCVPQNLYTEKVYELLSEEELWEKVSDSRNIFTKEELVGILKHPSRKAKEVGLKSE